MNCRLRNHKALSITLVAILCLSIFTGRVFAVPGCNASCCVGSQMAGHGHTVVQIVDDVPCPCCSTSVACNAEPSVSAVTFTATLHDGERYNYPLSFGKVGSKETQQEIGEFAFPSIEPPSKVPIYISTLTLIR